MIKKESIVSYCPLELQTITRFWLLKEGEEVFENNTIIIIYIVLNEQYKPYRL
jgi:hypothetical protein